MARGKEGQYSSREQGARDIEITMRFKGFLFGLIAGLLVSICLLVILIFFWGPWPVSDVSEKSNIAVVLGGSAGSRLKKGISLYGKNLVSGLLLSDRSKSDWQHIINNLCRECSLEGIQHTFQTGSVNTYTDATLVLSYCKSNNIKSIIVITDPYHSRRASIIFDSVFKGSGIKVTTVHSGDYGDLLPPDKKWWNDTKTMENLWLEFGKILYYKWNNILN